MKHATGHRKRGGKARSAHASRDLWVRVGASGPRWASVECMGEPVSEVKLERRGEGYSSVERWKKGRKRGENESVRLSARDSRGLTVGGDSGRIWASTCPSVGRGGY